MITITVYRDRDRDIHGFGTQGHALSAPEGKDIVCAAVSAIVQTAIFGLHEVAGLTMECTMEPDTDRITRHLPEDVRRRNGKAYTQAQAILAAMVVGLASVAEAHNDYVTINEEAMEDV